LAEDGEDGEEEQIKELVDMIGALQHVLGVTDALSKALQGCVMLQLLPPTPGGLGQWATSSAPLIISFDRLPCMFAFVLPLDCACLDPFLPSLALCPGSGCRGEQGPAVWQGSGTWRN